MNKAMPNQEADQVPCQLKSTQEWFASIITHPLGKKDTIQSRTPHGSLIAEEAARYVIPSSTLRPHQRMQIYNQQYWWRLLNTLHANFPLVTRLFGTHAFNEKIGIPYLLKYPPNHWSLHLLGKCLPAWVAECYKERDRSLVLNAAHLDWAFMASLIAPQHPFLDLSQILKDNPEGLLSQTFYLQPHITLFTWEYDLLTFRGNFLKQGPDYWVEHRFPALPKGKTYFLILYRNINNNLAWREISKGEFTLLQRFKLGCSMAEACDYIESQEASLYDFVAENLHKWLQDWTQAGWLTLVSHQESEFGPD
jgi:hypothetical protein